MATRSSAYPLGAYPRKVTLRDGTEVVLKPMVAEDRDALLKFFQLIPAADRYYLRDDVASPQVIDRWARELDYDRVLPLLAWVGTRIVADGTLHRQRAGGRQHIGELRLVVDPEHRQRGVDTAIIHDLVSMVHGSLLERVFMEVVAEGEGQAVEALQWLGFRKLAVLPRYARNMDGRVHDVVIYDLSLDNWLDRSPG